MSDQTPPPPPRRKIAGEAAAPTQPARKTPTPRKRPSAAKKAATDEAPATTKAPAKKTAAKKTAAKKTAAKKAPAKRTPAKKAAAKKAPVKKAAANKAPTAQAAAATDGSVTEATSTEATSPQASSTIAATKAPAKKPVARSVVPTAGVTLPPVKESTKPAATASRRTTFVTAAAALVLVAGAVIGWFGLQHFTGESADDSRSEAVDAATNAAETIFSFSFDDLDDHTAESKKLMTPAYAKQFDQIAPALTDIAPQREVVVEAVTRNAAVLPCGDECSTSKASVLVFVDLDRRTQDDDASTVFGNRIVVDLIKSDGDWKVGDIRAL